ncbi:MAG: hypothetical protein IKV36_04590 [Clostridia bacterium]|nr:hypothetical protein [Clostridia bacterium]
MKTCKNCGREIDEKAVLCVHCGCSIKAKKPIYKKWWFWVIAVIMIISIAVGSSGSNKNQTTNAGANQSVVSNEGATNSKVDSKFSGECGVSATAEMGSSIIGMPTINISISNVSGKEISAIKFYFIPLDVYGEEIKGWTSQNYLYTDEAIPAGGTNSCEYQFIEDSVKKGKLYVYSVYFADGSEWGNKDATKSTILKNGTCIIVDGVS